MPKLIVTSRYLKSGTNKNLANYVKYIATREGSVVVQENNAVVPATKQQQKLISTLLRDFPDSKDIFEYKEYIKAPTQKTASSLISEIIDRSADRLETRENYISYLANRPGAVKLDTHALFSQDNKPVDLNAVAKEIANHSGNVWTHVVSLRRDSAQQTGYDNLQAWRDLIKRQIPNIAKNQKIDLANLKWYAAFHDKQTNPHVHIVVYSTNEREGFLTEYGIEKIRSGFANDIYADELHHLYAQQTDIRNLLKKESAVLMHKLAEDIRQSNYKDKQLYELIMLLHNQLSTAKGKKVYGYVKQDIKQTVDRIFAKLAENESIQKMYVLWCEMEQTKHDVYSSAKVQFPALQDNPQFKSVKNMIIQTILKMGICIIKEDITIKNDVDTAVIEHTVKENVEKSEDISEGNNLPTYNTSITGRDCTNAILSNTILSLLVNLSRILEDGYTNSHNKLQSSVDRKLQKIIQMKKQQLGIKNEHSTHQKQSY